MKKLSYILTLLILTVAYSQAQVINLTLAEKLHSEGKLELAKSAINEAALNSQTLNNPRTWYVRLFIYKDLFKEAKGFKERIAEAENNRKIAIESGRKCIDLDTKKEYNKECYQIINFLRSSILSDGYTSFKAKDDKNAIRLLEEFMLITNSFTNTQEDAQANFIAGVACYRSNELLKASNFLSKAVMLNYPDGALYVYLAKVLWLQNKQMEAVLTLEKGFERYPKMKEIVSNLYEFNKELKRYENNRQVLTKATVNNPADIDYWILLAITYEDLAELKSDLDKNNVLDSAKIAYKKALELNPNDDVASSNLGILLYNQGVNIINTVSIDTDIVGIGEIQGKALVMFKESLPYMLKAFELNPKRKETLKGLENIYHIIGEFDKSNQFKLLYQKESE